METLFQMFILLYKYKCLKHYFFMFAKLSFYSENTIKQLEKKLLHSFTYVIPTHFQTFGVPQVCSTH